MTILPAGSFKVSDYRKAIPWDVKVICAIRAREPKRIIEMTTMEIGPDDLISWVRNLRFDHRPPLQDRPYDTEKGDFIPPQNDPDHIEAIPARIHDQRSFGRAPDAEKVVTTRGSDAGERKHIRDVRNTETQHQLKMAMKRGDPAAISRILGAVKQKTKPKYQWPKRSLSRRRANET